jgi:hypothetical protein
VTNKITGCDLNQPLYHGGSKLMVGGELANMRGVVAQHTKQCLPITTVPCLRQIAAIRDLFPARKMNLAHRFI